MKNIFTPGDVKVHIFKVKEADLAAFGEEVVHPVCSTFALAREMEYASRLFIQDMKEEGEEGIGISITIEHLNPALPGEELEIFSKLIEIRKNELHCQVKVRVGERVIATGRTGQKILRKEKISTLFNSIRRS